MKNGMQLVAVLFCMVAVPFTAYGAAPYSLAVTPSKSTVAVGDCLYFTGTATQGGKPASGVQIGVEDPMKQQSIAKAAKTDAKGKFTYYVENMCPAQYNDMVGLFRFKFFAGSTTTKSEVRVNTTKPAGVTDISAINQGTRSYRIKLTVNNADKGTVTVAPGKTVSLLKDNSFANSTIVATILDTNNKTLWKATYKGTRTVTPEGTTFVNPYYKNYLVNSTVTLNGSAKSRTFQGVGRFYHDTVNKEWTVGGVKIGVADDVTHGVATAAELGFSGPTCKTFLGFKARCSVSVGASAGLQLCLGTITPVGAALGPVKIGATASCCVEYASAKCNVLEASGYLSAIYK